MSTIRTLRFETYVLPRRTCFLLGLLPLHVSLLYVRMQRIANRVVAELLAELVDELALVAVGGVADDLPDALEQRELACGLAEEELDDCSDGTARRRTRQDPTTRGLRKNGGAYSVGLTRLSPSLIGP